MVFLYRLFAVLFFWFLKEVKHNEFYDEYELLSFK